MNWTTTGQEVGKELRQFWQGSRPGSPARVGSFTQERDHQKEGSSLTSPTSAVSHIAGRLDLPGRSDSPGFGSDFATGYSLGLIGGVRSWVCVLSSLSILLGSVHISFVCIRQQFRVSDLDIGKMEWMQC